MIFLKIRPHFTTQKSRNFQRIQVRLTTMNPVGVITTNTGKEHDHHQHHCSPFRRPPLHHHRYFYHYHFYTVICDKMDYSGGLTKEYWDDLNAMKFLSSLVSNWAWKENREANYRSTFLYPLQKLYLLNSNVHEMNMRNPSVENVKWDDWRLLMGIRKQTPSCSPFSQVRDL